MSTPIQTPRTPEERALAAVQRALASGAPSTTRRVHDVCFQAAAATAPHGRPATTQLDVLVAAGLEHLGLPSLDALTARQEEPRRIA